MWTRMYFLPCREPKIRWRLPRLHEELLQWSWRWIQARVRTPELLPERPWKYLPWKPAPWCPRRPQEHEELLAPRMADLVQLVWLPIPAHEAMERLLERKALLCLLFQRQRRPCSVRSEPERQQHERRQPLVAEPRRRQLVLLLRTTGHLPSRRRRRRIKHPIDPRTRDRI
jgi:hypothetical protein